MDYTFDTKLKNKTANGIIDSGIRTKVSDAFENALMITFKFSSHENPNHDLNMLILTHNRQDMLGVAKQLKKLNHAHLAINYVNLGDYDLVAKITEHKKDGSKIKVPIKSGNNFNIDLSGESAKERDFNKRIEKVDKKYKEAFDKKGKSGIVYDFKAHHDKNYKPYVSFKFQLVPAWNPLDISDDILNCVMYPSDLNEKSSELNHCLKAEKLSDEHKNAVRTYKIVGHFNKKHQFRVMDYLVGDYSKRLYHKLTSSHINLKNLKKKGQYDLIIRLNQNRYKFGHDKRGVYINVNTSVKVSKKTAEKIHNDPKHKDKYLPKQPSLDNMSLIVIKQLEVEKTLSKAMLNKKHIKNFLIAVDELTKSINDIGHCHYSEKQIAKELQALIKAGIITVVNQEVIK